MNERVRPALVPLTSDDGVDARVAAYIEGGSGNSARRNERAWQHWWLVPNVLRVPGEADTSVRLFGRRWSAPVFAAPWGNHGLLCPDGETETARGVRAAGLGFSLSSAGNRTIEDIAVESGPFLAQIYVPDDRDAIRPYLGRVVAAGACAVLVTVDVTPGSDLLPFREHIGDLVRGRHPDWSPDEPPAPARDLRAADIGWIAVFTGLPVLAKGVLNPDDAAMCIRAGAAGVVVSNHGGGNLPGASHRPKPSPPSPTASATAEWCSSTAGSAPRTT